MSDRLYLSCWVRGFQGSNMLRHFAKFIDLFPVSKLSQRTQTMRVYALEYAEPPVSERVFEPGTDAAEIAGSAVDFAHEDCCVELDLDWDLWQAHGIDGGGWEVGPSRVTITCFGPEFDNETGDNLRIDFGLDSVFLPAGDPAALRMHESNLRSLLHLVTEIEQNMPLERRLLWSESGANFADLLAVAVSRNVVN